jgi:probable HAF family extracellular repeat protein
MTKRRFLVIAIGILVCGGVVAGLLLTRLRSSRAFYRVTFLPSLGGFRINPHSLNDLGQVVGVAETPAHMFYMFLWDKENGFRKLGRYDQPAHVGRLWIDDAGQIAGTVTDPNGHRRAFLRDGDGDIRMVETFGGDHSTTHAMNNRGQLVGYAENAAHEQRAFIWDRQAGLRRIGTLGGDQSMALSVNDLGQIAGWSLTTEGQSHLFMWDPLEGVTDLGPTGTGPPRCLINNRGFVVRSFDTPAGKTHFRTWTREGGARDLDFVAGESGEPCALNDANQFLIRGKPTDFKLFGRTLRRRQECYLWDPNDGIIPLAERVPIGNLTYLKVTDLNNKGCITAIVRTKDADQLRAVFLEPIHAR